MRIAIVGNFALSGNQTMAVRALPLAESLAARGHRLLMVLPARSLEDRPGRIDRNGVMIETVGPGMPIPGLSLFFQAARLLLICLRWKPDAVYCFKPIAHSWAVLASLWLLRGLHIFGGRLVLDTDDWEGYGGWNDLQPFPGWLKRFIAWQEMWSLRHADEVTVASKALLKTVMESIGRDSVYLPNAVLPESPCTAPLPDREAARSLLGLPDGPIVLAYTRFVEFNPTRLLDTFQSIRSRIGGATLLVAGTGLNQEEDALRRLAAERGLGDDLILAGWVVPEKLPLYLAACDMALYLMDDTMLNRTKCPMKLVELLGAGVPVVADRVGQAVEYVEDGRTGLLVAPGDVDAMAMAAVVLLEDRGRREMMASAARAAVHDRWTWDAWAEVAERALASR